MVAVTRLNRQYPNPQTPQYPSVAVNWAAAHDLSPPLRSLVGSESHSLRPEVVSAGSRLQQSSDEEAQGFPQPVPEIVAAKGSTAVEQTTMGTRASPEIFASFDGLGAGFEGPQGKTNVRNPSDNSLAVGPNHVFQIVNSQMAIFDKKGKVLYGPMPTNTLFKGFGGAAEATNSGDAVVRYDQLANRWLVVMPLFRRGAPRDGLVTPIGGGPAVVDMPAHEQPGKASKLHVPAAGEQIPRPQRQPGTSQGPYSMCYAISTGPDPLGSYYRYELLRPLFPDYPRPAIWPDGYYIPTSTGDDVIQKQACVVDREKMLRGEPATEQCLIIDGVNFLNNADIDGKNLPPKGAPNIMMAAGGTQLKKVFEDDSILVWRFHVDWKNPASTKVTGPEKIPVAPYHYLGDGQLSNTVPQPGTDRRLDSQGDKLMSRLVYRRIGNQESIVAVHSVNTTARGGGVRWYEFRLDRDRNVKLYQQGTYCPASEAPTPQRPSAVPFRWMASPAMDRFGNIGIGYSFGSAESFPGQRFAGRLASDPLGQLTTQEAVLAEGGASQAQMRWEDYTQTALDPTDDATIWYVGDYIKLASTSYSTRIGAFRLKRR